MNNQMIIEKLFKVQIALKLKNAAAASAIERATIPLLEYDAPLADLSRSELIKIKGIGTQTAELILKIVQGATQYEIVSTVAKTKKKERYERI
jgi:3-methyladenine DNA glycosylase/8-oxoguanine DNA glycosylase